MLVFERWNGSVLLGTETFENSDARVHYEFSAPCRVNRLDEAPEEVVAILIVNPDSGFDRYRDFDCRLHRLQAFAYQLGTRHETGSELPALNPITGAPDVNIYLVVAEFGAATRRFGHQIRIAATHLQGNGAFRILE